MNRSLALAALAGSIAACVNVQSEMVGPVKYPPVPADSVTVFLSEQDLKNRGYEWETVAILYASGSADYTSEGGMLKKVREEAGSHGANGIILGQTKDPNLGERLLFGSGAERKSQMVAIRWWPQGAHAPAVTATGADTTKHR